MSFADAICDTLRGLQAAKWVRCHAFQRCLEISKLFVDGGSNFDSFQAFDGVQFRRTTSIAATGRGV